MLAWLALVASPAATEPVGRAREFLVSAFHVAKNDLARIAAGHVYSRTLPVQHPREVATLGKIGRASCRERVESAGGAGASRGRQRQGARHERATANTHRDSVGGS